MVLMTAATVGHPQFAGEAYYAKLHAVVLVGILAIAGWRYPWTRYRAVATILALFYATPYAMHWVRDHPQGPAGAVIVAGFALLAGGMWISWHKRALLDRLPEPPPQQPFDSTNGDWAELDEMPSS